VKRGNLIYKQIKEFTVTGQGTQSFAGKLGFVRVVIPAPLVVGIQFDCLTPNVKVQVEKISIAPASKEIFFRRKFMLNQAPVMAKATFRVCPSYELYINGKKVDAGSKVYPAGIQKTVNIQPYLRKGENTVAFGREFYSWSGGNPNWRFEGFAVDREGKLTRLLGDTKWKCTVKRQSNWMQADFNDSGWKNAVLTDISKEDYITLPNGKKVGTGLDPAHMGMLNVTPNDRKFPVFTDSETPVFIVKIPAGLTDKTTLSYYIKNQDSGVVGKRTVVKPQYSESAGLAISKVKLTTLPTGPYRIYWKLTATAGQIFDNRSDEFIVTGPIAQDLIKPANYERELERRMKLVRTIDCATASTDNREFLDHAGMYNTPKLNKGRIVKKDGMTYRETGQNMYDYFAYRLHDMKLGEPYLIEIIIPDNDIRGIYSGVVEQLPVPFPNNPAAGSRGWFSTTASCITGKRYPLTGKTKKLRYLYFPGSQTAAVVIMNAAGGKAAAASKINIYTLKGGVPGMEMPKSQRMFGTHFERVSQSAVSGHGGNPLLRQFTMDYRRNNWYYWYKIAERKIKLLRFQGMNMTIEGAYMYSHGEIPIVKGNTNIAEAVIDPLQVMIQMYKANNIHCLLGFEFITSPSLQVELDRAGSQRQLRTGKAATIYFLDRTGKPVISSLGCGLNFLHPAVKNATMELISFIYDNYQATGGVDGLFMVSGSWWLPTFSVLNSLPDEVGYGDLTVGLFEKESGIKLAVKRNSPNRFEQRFKLLTGKYRKRWMQWRTRKVLDFFKAVEARITAKQHKWPLYLCATLIGKGKNGAYNKFVVQSATQQMRNKAWKQAYNKVNLPLEKYRGLPGINLVLSLHKQTFKGAKSSADFLPMHGWNTNQSLVAASKDFPWLYSCLDGLDEKDCPATAAENWIWSHTARAAFIIRGAEANAAEEFVNMSKTVVPKMIINAWTDCNWESSGTQSLRMFCRAFYATPDADFKNMADDRRYYGISAAQTAVIGKDAWLRLVNATPYPLTGWLNAEGKMVRDMVYDKELPGQRIKLIMRPYSVRIFKCTNAKPAVFSCKLSLPNKTADDTLKLGRIVLQQSSLLKKIPAPLIAKLRKYSSKPGDAVKVLGILDNFEVATRLLGVFDKPSILNQQRLLKQFKKGRARIICASTKPYTDLNGNLWLPDQNFNGSSYGNEFANFADRGSLPIAGTKSPRVYQTEAYGKQLFYHFPVPNGTYKVYVHIAETYPPNRKKGRLFSIKVGPVTKKNINPVKKAGGFAKPYIVVWKNVVVKNGILSIEAWGGVGLSGIEIERQQ
ncbi:MAG: hypothetical protein L3J71_18165, partial [Victivallaceae bacterium]|nr:hypothetical protein [Victivallaceae bacterium]